MPPADSDSFWFIYWEEVEKEEDGCHRHLGWTAPETLFTIEGNMSIQNLIFDYIKRSIIWHGFPSFSANLLKQ